MTIRLVALDLDGTLLDPYGKLTRSVRDAVDRLFRRELRVVLCTGRRFRTALPHAQALGLSGAIVVNNGALVKDLATSETLQHAYLPDSEFDQVIAHVRSHGPPLVYVDTYRDGVDIFTEHRDRAHPFQREYLDDQGAAATIVDDVARVGRDRVIMVSAMADEPSLEELRRSAHARFGARIQTHSLINKNYRGQILEFLSPAAGKWQALERLAASWGVEFDEIAAVGDDTNDAELLRRVGLGIAMGNALPEVRAAARAVVRGNAEGGAVEAIEHILTAL
ncbi:MAG TPA: HAD family hydrolase [Myxococcota bacterium]|nr:HAD family hydrolase [Myxococcota bacterium]